MRSFFPNEQQCSYSNNFIGRLSYARSHYTGCIRCGYWNPCDTNYIRKFSRCAKYPLGHSTLRYKYISTDDSTYYIGNSIHSWFFKNRDVIRCYNSFRRKLCPTSWRCKSNRYKYQNGGNIDYYFDNINKLRLRERHPLYGRQPDGLRLWCIIGAKTYRLFILKQSYLLNNSDK